MNSPSGSTGTRTGEGAGITVTEIVGNTTNKTDSVITDRNIRQLHKFEVMSIVTHLSMALNAGRTRGS